MILRLDKMLIDLPRPGDASPDSAAAVQELMGGRFGEMSTLMNYTFQSFNFRGREQFRPFYDLIANIAAEEYGHVELVAYTINLLLTGATTRDPDPAAAPLEDALHARNSYHFVNGGQTALPMDSQGQWWNGSYVFSSGNLKLDLLHNFFLECGARAGKIRVYEMAKDPVARAMIGYLLVRGGVHIVAYAKALEKLSGVDVGKLLPIPDISNKKFPEARQWEEQGVHRVLYRFSTDDYRQAGQVWAGTHPEDGSALKFEDGPPSYIATPPDLPAEPQLGAPTASVEPGFLQEVAKRLFGS